MFTIPIPKVGNKYEFYDDGKITPMRRYTAEVLEVITPKEAEEVKFPLYVYEESDWEPTTRVVKGEDIVGEVSLYDFWKEELEYHDWLFATETDYFVKCSIPRYDEYPIWFVRMTDGNWFSMDIQSGWQGGKLDVTGELTKYYKEIWKSNKV